MGEHLEPFAPAVEVDMTGLVTVNGRPHGYVDRWERNRTVRTWRFVRVGGATNGVRYRTRAEAISALVEQQ
jgi:hypothetical protein